VLGGPVSAPHVLRRGQGNSKPIKYISSARGSGGVVHRTVGMARVAVSVLLVLRAPSWTCRTALLSVATPMSNCTIYQSNCAGE